MPELILWKTHHINRLKKDIDTLFDRFCGEYGIQSAHRVIKRMPSFELTDTGPSLILLAVLPDVDPDDIVLSITGDLLTVKGNIHREIIDERENYYTTQDTFTRTIKIPYRIEVDAVNAVYENGILKVVMPRTPPEKTKIIKIRKIKR
ncbi:MAG: Hsp20/alpha crystallin family protein [Deltaproteobacteria bacterium]|nr:Hsp20/alpha crystallin family protein [Deltaproteobacteria bacterium]